MNMLQARRHVCTPGVSADNLDVHVLMRMPIVALHRPVAVAQTRVMDFGFNMNTLSNREGLD